MPAIVISHVYLLLTNRYGPRNTTNILPIETTDSNKGKSIFGISEYSNFHTNATSRFHLKQHTKFDDTYAVLLT